MVTTMAHLIASAVSEYHQFSSIVLCQPSIRPLVDGSISHRNNSRCRHTPLSFLGRPYLLRSDGSPQVSVRETSQGDNRFNQPEVSTLMLEVVAVQRKVHGNCLKVPSNALFLLQATCRRLFRP